jgi:hypothetical protein
MKTATILIACCACPVVWGSTEVPLPSDVSSVDAIIAASYDALSGPVGAPRQWERYLNLLDPDARLVSTSFDAKSGRPKVTRLGRDEYVRYENDYLVKSGFIDRKLGCITNHFGNIASVRCGFEGLEQSKRVERGVAFFQLYHDGIRWWILSVVWDQERPGHSIPAGLQSAR